MITAISFSTTEIDNSSSTNISSPEVAINATVAQEALTNHTLNDSNSSGTRAESQTSHKSQENILKTLANKSNLYLVL